MCNCKKGGKAQVMNNVDSVDHITYSKEIYDRIVLPNTTGEYDDLEKVELMLAFSTLYPNASQSPSIPDAIEQIKIGIELYNAKFQQRFKR
jgi:hypothetical protein